MSWLTLPEPESSREPAFADPAAARAWLAGQPQAHPVLMQANLTEQVDAIDAARLNPARAVELLDLLHSACLPAQASLEARFLRKPLPLPAEEERIFLASQNLWTRLGIAYLRLAPHFAPKDKCPLLHRAANAIRQAQYAHFLAGRECPAELDQLLLAILVQAERGGILRLTHVDPDYRHLGEATIGGLLVWAFLLRLVDPYRLTAGQLTVANRALRRWRELCSFQAEAGSSQHASAIFLPERFALSLPDDIPHWLDVQPIIRKIHSRTVSLRAGATPESLKLGRELSGTACIRLLADIELQLRTPPAASGVTAGKGDLPLAFGAEQAYALLREEALNPDASMDVQSQALANQRMAVFGFDQVSRMPTAVRKLHIPCEAWIMHDGQAVRRDDGPRRLAPCLIAANLDGKKRLGVMRRLTSGGDGILAARLEWYPETVEACRLRQPGLRDAKSSNIAVFLIRHAEQVSLLLPSNAPIRPGHSLAIEARFPLHLVPTEVIERGIDFVRYACRPG